MRDNPARLLLHPPPNRSRDKNGTGKSDPAPPHFEQAPRLNLPDTAPAGGKTNKPIRHDSPKKKCADNISQIIKHGLTIFPKLSRTYPAKPAK